MPKLIPHIPDGDWTALRRGLNKLASVKLGFTASPTFAGMTLTGLTASTLIGANASKLLESVTIGSSLDYTRPTLNTIQDIRVTASPTWVGATLSGITQGSVLFAGASGVISQDNSNLFWDNTNNRLGIGTTTIPHGGVGAAKFAIDGASSNVAGPHVQFTTTSDNYPLMQILNWGHDDISIRFDSYWDGANKSSDAGSNYAIFKVSDSFKIMYDSGVARGGAVTWNEGIVLNTSGLVTFGGAINITTVAAEGSDVDKFLVDSSGVVKYRTGTQVLSDIGASASGHNHSGVYEPTSAALTDLTNVGIVTGDSYFLVGTGSGALAWETTTTVRTSIGLGTGDSPQFTGIELGHASDTTLTRVSAGIIAIQGTTVMMAGDAPSSHTIASHSDTTGTGAELDTLTGGGETALHSHAGGADSEKVKVDVGATADYIGAANSDGVLRTGTSLSYVDGGNFVTINTVQDIRTSATPTLAGLIIADGGTIGQSAGPLMTFDDTNNLLNVTGGKLSVGDSLTTIRSERAFNQVSTDAVMRVWRFTNSTTAAPAVEMIWGNNDTVDGDGNFYWDFFVHGTDGGFKIRDRSFGQGNAMRFIIDSAGGIHTPDMKTGTTQANAGAATGELWADTDDANTVKLGA